MQRWKNVSSFLVMTTDIFCYDSEQTIHGDLTGHGHVSMQVKMSFDITWRLKSYKMKFFMGSLRKVFIPFIRKCLISVYPPPLNSYKTKTRTKVTMITSNFDLNTFLSLIVLHEFTFNIILIDWLIDSNLIQRHSFHLVFQW